MTERTWTKPNKSAAYLKAARIGRGETRQEAARHIGCSVSTLGRYEREGISGDVLCSRVFRLCKHYDINVDTLCDLARQQA